MKITIHTDGAASGNPGPGGYGAVLESGPHRKELWGGYRRTTNNRMELRAVLAGLNAIKKLGQHDIAIYSDSKYAVEGASAWLPAWKRNNWRTADRKPIANHDIWEQIDTAIERHRSAGSAVTFTWVPGHSTITGNVLANDAAQQAAYAGTDEDKEDL